MGINYNTPTMLVVSIHKLENPEHLSASIYDEINSNDIRKLSTISQSFSIDAPSCAHTKMDKNERGRILLQTEECTKTPPQALSKIRAGSSMHITQSVRSPWANRTNLAGSATNVPSSKKGRSLFHIITKIK